MLLAWAVPAAAWFLVHSPAAEPCGEATVPMPPERPQGATETCARGKMTADTAAQVRPGTTITLSCQLSPPQHSILGIFLNGSELRRGWGSSLSARFLVQSCGKHTFTCKTLGGHGKKIICGIHIRAGNPPDEPRNVSCVQEGTQGHPTCSWEKGRLTHIPTTYLLQLSKGPDVLCLPEGQQEDSLGSLALSKLDLDSTYTVVVTASNQLGTAVSQPLSFMLRDIVKPPPPDLLLHFGSSSSASCTLSWQEGTPAHHCHLRYRPLSRTTWSRVENVTSENCSLDALEPHTTYEFQVRCKIHPERGLWSNWRVYQAQTPEAAAPSAGFQMNITPEATSIPASCDEIPAQLQRGCILGHQVQLQRKGWEEAPDVPSAGDWVPVVLTCSLLILAACSCSVPPARKGFQSLLSALLPQSGAIPDPSNAAWAKEFLALKAELRWPSSPFLHNTGTFEEPQTTPVEENFMKTKALVLEDEVLGDSSGRRDNWLGQEGLGYKVLPGSGQGEEGDEQHFPHPYKQLGVEVTEHPQDVPEYLANPMAEMATTSLSLLPAGEHPELEGRQLPAFPTTPSQGNLTLDVVRINCSPCPW